MLKDRKRFRQNIITPRIMLTRETILNRARTELDPETFDMFNQHLPDQGPYTEEIISGAIWEAMEDVNKTHPVKIPEHIFISPTVIFEVDCGPVLG